MLNVRCQRTKRNTKGNQLLRQDDSNVSEMIKEKGQESGKTDGSLDAFDDQGVLGNTGGRVNC